MKTKKDKKRLLWISNVLPMDVANTLKLSVAGKKMDLSLIESLSKIIECDVLSVSREYPENIHISKLYENVDFYHIKNNSGKNTISSNIKRLNHVKKYLFSWCTKFDNYQKYVLMTNYDYSICRPLLIAKKRFDLKIYSFVEDYYFLNKRKGIKNYFLNIYNMQYLNKGLKLLNKFNGVICLNNNVRRYINNKKIYKTLIGVNDEQNYGDIKEFGETIKIAYAGTLNDFNGINIIMNAFDKLPLSNVELHFFGFGPLEKTVNDYCEKKKNAFFHGYISSDLIISKLSSMDILINIPDSNGDAISDFNFPSKLIDYLCAARPIISSDFSALPDEYKPFLHILNQRNESELAKSIVDIINCDKNMLLNKCLLGQAFIKHNQRYDKIAKNIMLFMTED